MADAKRARPNDTSLVGYRNQRKLAILDINWQNTRQQGCVIESVSFSLFFDALSVFALVAIVHNLLSLVLLSTILHHKTGSRKRRTTARVGSLKVDAKGFDVWSVAFFEGVSRQDSANRNAWRDPTSNDIAICASGHVTSLPAVGDRAMQRCACVHIPWQQQAPPFFHRPSSRPIPSPRTHTLRPIASTVRRACHSTPIRIVYPCRCRLSPIPYRIDGMSSQTSTHTIERCRILICGGGIVGTCVAYYLSERGVLSTVIERHKIAGSASGKAAGFLAFDWNDDSPSSELSRLSFKLHQQLANKFQERTDYRPVRALGIASTADARSNIQEKLPSWLDGNVLGVQV